MRGKSAFTLFIALFLLFSGCAAESADGDGSLPASSEAVSSEAESAPSEASSPEPEPARVYALEAYDGELPSLRELFAEDFLVGAAVNTGMLKDGSRSCKTILKHYNILTCENEMKPEYMNPSEGRFSFDAADRFLDFCGENGIAAHGHCLVWHSQVPQWWFREDGGTVSRETLLARLDDYIATVAGRYAGRVALWDVVNEALNDDGTLRGLDGGSYYTSVIGDLNGDGQDYDYIEEAFIKAREADPDAELIYNDYSLESSAPKARAAYTMLRDFIERGIPVDGVGLQMHIQYGWPDIGAIRRNLGLLCSLRELDPDFSVHITELDMSAFDWSDSATSKEIGRTQALTTAVRWSELFKLFRELDIDTVTTWGIYDGGSWLNGYPVAGRSDSPLLFDRAYRAKPEFWALVDPALISPALDERYK